MGLSPAEIRILGGGATQFSLNAGTPELSVRQFDAGIYAGDDWRMRSNLTLSLGLRYETQTNIHDARDLAPRIAMAWAPGGGGKSARAKTVVRAGFGMFYDRFALANTLTALRYNGILQQQYVENLPDFFPLVPTPASLAGFRTSQTIQEVSASLRAPYIMQSALTLERRLPWNITLATTYTNAHGVHAFRSDDINAPLPGRQPEPPNHLDSPKNTPTCRPFWWTTLASQNGLDLLHIQRTAAAIDQSLKHLLH
jgi:TonB dependent receptor